MPEFYHNLVTEKSFKLLQDLKKKFDFILIGGWAIFLYSQALKSKDIDIILDYDGLGEFRKEFNLFKNERLKKYEVKTGGIDIDIYLPYFSDLGIPVEDIKKYSQSQEGFLVPSPEILLILKTNTYQARKGTNKGNKDLIDIFSLLQKQIIDWKKYQELIKKYKLDGLNEQFKNLVFSTKSLPELGLLNHKIARLKKKVLEEIK